jgi:hypothetical protein
MGIRRHFLLGIGAVLLPCSVLAQSPSVVTPRRISVGAGVGYAGAGGSADVAEHRDAGWHFCGALRYPLTRRITLGAVGDFSSMDFNPDEYFRALDPPIILENPEDYLVGGRVNVFSLGGEAIWEAPVAGSTVPYIVGGAGYYVWEVDPISGRLPSSDEEFVIDIPDESAIGFRFGGGARFALGATAAIWAEVSASFIGAEGGTLTVMPLRVIVSGP